MDRLIEQPVDDLQLQERYYYERYGRDAWRRKYASDMYPDQPDTMQKEPPFSWR